MGVRCENLQFNMQPFVKKLAGVGRKLRLLSELLRNSRILLLAHTNIGVLRGFAKGLPRRGGSGRHDKAEQMTEVACCKKNVFWY